MWRIDYSNLCVALCLLFRDVWWGTHLSFKFRASTAKRLQVKLILVIGEMETVPLDMEFDLVLPDTDGNLMLSGVDCGIGTWDPLEMGDSFDFTESTMVQSSDGNSNYTQVADDADFVLDEICLQQGTQEATILDEEHSYAAFQGLCFVSYLAICWSYGH